MALALMHKNGIAHRDIKPENIMVTKDYKVKVIDLGYGVDMNVTNVNKTRLGTSGYMAPEIVAGLKYNGFAADIFAFGTMMLVLRVMKYPFDDAAPTDKYYRCLVNDPNRFWK